MPEGNAWKHSPDRQARLIQDMQNPEYLRRREMYRRARGREAKEIVAAWNVAWNIAGRPTEFPDLPEFKIAEKKRRAEHAVRVQALVEEMAAKRREAA